MKLKDISIDQRNNKTSIQHFFSKIVSKVEEMDRRASQPINEWLKEENSTTGANIAK